MNNTDNPTPPVGGKERTAMQRLYDALGNSHPAQWNDIMLHDKTELLELERKQILEARSDGMAHVMSGTIISSDDYFQSKYQQQ